MFKCFKDKEFFNKFIKISLPVMISAFISFFVNFLDNIMVGTVSNECVSGVYAASEISYLFLMAIYGAHEGAGIFIQQYNGTRDQKHIHECVRYKWLMSILLLVFGIPLCYIFGDDLIRVYSKSDSNFDLIYNEGMSYLKIIILSYIPLTISNIYSTTLREVGDSKNPMIASIIAIITNSILNALFIFGFKMGGVGAAIATVISRIAELAYLLIVSNNKNSYSTYKSFSEFSIDKKLFKEMSKKTILLFLNEMGFSIGMMLQSMAFSQRDNVLSSISIVTTVSNVFTILCNGISIGIGVMVGSSLGRDEFDKAKDEDKKLLEFGLIIASTLGLFLIILNRVIPMMFPEVIEEQKILASKLIIIFALSLPFAVMALTSYFTLRVGGKTLQTFILDSLTMLFLYVPVAWLLAKLTKIDMVYIYLIVRSIDIIKAIVGMTLVKKGDWVKNITIK